MKSVPNLSLRLQRSRLERLGMAIAHLLALPMPWLAAMPLSVKVLVSTGVVISAGWWGWRRQPVLPAHLWLLPNGKWALDLAGREIGAVLGTGIYRTPWLIVLPLVLADGKRLRLVLWPDSAEPADLRRLRAWLRWGALGGP